MSRKEFECEKLNQIFNILGGANLMSKWSRELENIVTNRTEQVRLSQSSYEEVRGEIKKTAQKGRSGGEIIELIGQFVSV